MPLTLGDSKIPWGGLYDEFDPRDSVPGTFKELTNVVVGRKYSTIENRGAFVKWKDLPTEGNGLKAGLTIVKVLHGAQFKVTKPSEQIITVLICLCSYQPSGGGGLNYTWRVFQNPSYTAPNFGASTTWQEKEVFYIDIVEFTKTLTRNTSPERFSFTVTPPVNGAYFDGDLSGGYIYLEDTANFSSPNLHLAEGDAIVENSNNDFNAATNTLTVCTESAHSTMWTTSDTDVVRYHKNLEDGFLPYKEIVSTSDTFFDQYTFSHFIEGETLHISVHAGESGRASFEMRINYIKRTDFGNGMLFGQSDYSYTNAGNFDRYDKHLVYGFPNYKNIIKNGSATFDNKKVNIAGSIVAGSYDKITGKFTSSNNIKNYVIGRHPGISMASLVQVGQYWAGMCVANGNVYAAANGDDIFMQVAGIGDFVKLNQTLRAWGGMASLGSDVYACDFGGDIYKQTGGVGNFAALSQTSRNWYGMCSANKNVYATVNGGDIYMQTGGAGNFVGLGQTVRNWTGITSTINGDVYACVNGGDIYKQTGGAGNFVALSQTSRAWQLMTTVGNDVFACVDGGDIYVLENATGNFVALGQTSRKWFGICSFNNKLYSSVTGLGTPNGQLYASNLTPSLDVSYIHDEFFISESDVHGRGSSFKEFNLHSKTQTSYITSNPSLPGINYKPIISDVEWWQVSDGVQKSSQETGFNNNTFFYVLMCGVYNSFRFGLHSESIHGITDAHYTVPFVWCKIPASKNKNLDRVAIVMAAGYANQAAMTIQALLTDLRTVKIDSIVSSNEWSFYLCFPEASASYGDTYQYVKNYRVDKSYYDTVNIGGDHLDLTANPSYSRKTQTIKNKKDIILSSDLELDPNGYSVEKQARYVMVGDYSFGAKTSIVIKNRLYFSGVKYQEYQLGSIQSEIFEDSYNVFYSGIGQFGGNYHGFDFTQNKIACSDIGPVIAVNWINFPQGLEQVITHDRDSLIILGENGVKFVDLSNNLLSSPVISTSPGDTCIARNSVVNENGILFCAGETGVYMFRGYEKVDITINLHPKARIKKTWRELSRAKKQKAIGAFHRGRGYYILCIPDDNTFYVFDIQGAMAK